MPRIQRWIAGLEVLLAVGVTILGALVVNMTMQLWLGTRVPPDTTPIAPRGAATSEVPDVDTVLAALGRSTMALETAPALTATVCGIATHDGIAYAVVEDPNGAQRLYGAGEALGGGTITAIDWNGVVVERDGRRRLLPLATQPRATGTPEAGPPPTSAPAPATDVRQVSADSFLVDRHTLLGQAGNMSALLAQLRAVPEVQDGEPIGFRVFAISEDSIFRRLGLREGDVVRRVNGNTLHDPAALLAFLEGMGDASRIALDLMRAGRPATLVYDLR